MEWILEQVCVSGVDDPFPCMLERRGEPCESCGWPGMVGGPFSVYQDRWLELHSHIHPRREECRIRLNVHTVEFCHQIREANPEHRAMIPPRANWGRWIDGA